MPCAPAFRPVKAEVQAQSVIGGQTDRSGARLPLLTRSARWGSRPSERSGSTRSKVAESQPSTTSFGATSSLEKRSGWGWSKVDRPSDWCSASARP